MLLNEAGVGREVVSIHFLVLSGPELTRELITKLLTSHPLNGGVFFCGSSAISFLLQLASSATGKDSALGSQEPKALTHVNKSCSNGLVKNTCVGRI